MEAYKPAQRLVDDIHFQLHQLESGADTSDLLKNDASHNLNRLGSAVDQLKHQLTLLPSDRRVVWTNRVKSLTDEYESLRSSLARFFDTAFRKTEAQRAELFATRGSNGAGAVAIDSLAEEAASLDRSKHRVGQLIDQGVEIMDALRSQRNTFKGAHKKVLDIMASLGLSRNIMTAVGRRSSMDRALVYGGMLFVLFVLYVAYRYV